MDFKGVSFYTALSLVVGNMVGTGVFTTLGLQVEQLPSPTSLLFIWALGGFLALCGALSYAEVAAALPRSGGECWLLASIYHPAVGCMAGWVSMTVGFAAPLALTAMAFAAHLRVVFPGLNESATAACLLAGVTLIHSRSLKAGGLFQNSFTLLKVVLLLSLIVAGFFTSRVTSFTAGLRPASGGSFFSSPFAICLVYVMYAYSGWNAAAYVTGEIHKPGRNLPRALVLGTVLVTVLFVGANAVFLRSSSLAALSGRLDVAPIACSAIFGEAGGKLVSALIALGLVSCASAMTWAGPRVTQSMGEQFPVLGFFAAGRSEIPSRALWLQLALAMGLLWTRSFELVLLYTQFTLCFCSFLTVAGVFVLRWRRPGLERPYRTWGHPVTPLLFLAGNGLVLVHLAVAKPLEALVGLATMGSGLLVYFKHRRVSTHGGSQGGSKRYAWGLFIAWTLVTTGRANDPDNLARWLAGMPGRESRDAAWQEHARIMNGTWARFSPRIRYIQAWASREVPQVKTVVYPFGGPDYVHVQAMFPQASSYVLCGLEPVGKLPDNPSRETLLAVRQALGTLFNAGYFVTKEMAGQLNGSALQGTLPILCVMLVRSGSTILSVAAEANHAQITFYGPAHKKTRTLHYYRTDLTRPILARHLNGSALYLKSASYLLHSNQFAQLREAILESCSIVVQDDSGIPFRYFDRVRWELRPYGNYTAPLSIFREHYQADLAQCYQRSNPEPLAFGAGYNWRPREAGLLIAIRH